MSQEAEEKHIITQVVLLKAFPSQISIKATKNANE